MAFPAALARLDALGWLLDQQFAVASYFSESPNQSMAIATCEFVRTRRNGRHKMQSPTTSQDQVRRAAGSRISQLAEHALVLQQCWARSLSWRMLLIYNAGLSDEQRALAKGLAHVWAPDINPRLKRSMLTFKWWRDATAEEARLVVKFFPTKRRYSTDPALLAA